MSRRDPMIAVQQMYEHAVEVRQIVGSFSQAELEADRLRTLAVVRLLEILGEAARRVPQEMQAAYDYIPWRELIGLRNRLIHAYDEIDMDILWEILRSDLPVLVAQLQNLLEENGLG